MSVLTIATRDLVGLLTDALHTTGTVEYPALDAVLLDTATAEVQISDEDGDGTEGMFDTITSDVLVATSTDAFHFISQGHAACTGRLHMPVLVSATDVENVITVFTKKAKTAPKSSNTHRCRLEISGHVLTVEEDPELRPGGTEVIMRTIDTEEYPRGLSVLMDVDPTVPYTDKGKVVPAAFGIGLPGVAYEIVGKVAKRRKMLPAQYASHHKRGVMVTVGSMWRVYLLPTGLDEEKGEHTGPLVPLFEPNLKPRDDAASQGSLAV